MSIKKEGLKEMKKDNFRHTEIVNSTESSYDLKYLREFSQPKNTVMYVHFFVVEEHHRRR